jgi:hypothetical protein
MSQTRNQPAKKVITDAAALVAHLNGLKAEAGEDGKWWKGVIEIEWSQVRKGGNNTGWISVFYTNPQRLRSRLVVRFTGERHTGQIMPNTDAGVAELAARVNAKVRVEKRTKKVAVQVQKWTTQVKTAEDGISLLYGEDGLPVLPGDESLSPYYQAASLVNEAFSAEATERVERGAALLAKANELVRGNKGVTPGAILDAFIASQPPGYVRAPGDVIVDNAGVQALRRVFPAVDTLIKGAITAPITKIASLTQEFIGASAKQNANKPLPNPMTRFAVNFDKDTGVAEIPIHDKGLPYTENGRPRFEFAKVDGEPVNADNVHLFLLSRSTIDGIANWDSVCISSMGVSMPVKADLLIIERPVDNSVGLDDFFGDDAGGSQPAAAAAAPARTGAPPATAAAGAAGAADDYGDLLDDLTGGVAGRGQ